MKHNWLNLKFCETEGMKNLRDKMKKVKLAGRLTSSLIEGI